MTESMNGAYVRIYSRNGFEIAMTLQMTVDDTMLCLMDGQRVAMSVGDEP